MCFDDDEPFFAKAKPLNIAAALSRAHLRGSMRKLVAIRCACGFRDKDTGENGDDADLDPFVVLVREFETHIQQVQEVAADAVNDMQERAQIRKDITAAGAVLAEMRTIVEQANDTLNTAELKNKSIEKIGSLQEAFEHYRTTLVRCEKCYDEAKRMTANMSWNVPSKLSSSSSYQKALKLLAQRSGMDLSGNEPNEEELRELDTIGGGVSLESDAETREQMVLITKQKREVKSSLDQIYNSVQMVHQMALQLRTEAQQQVAVIHELDEHMQFQVENIRSGNARLAKLHASLQPFNVCVNACICIIILAAIGFLLWRFDVLKVSNTS